MHASFADQLTGLDLSGFTIGPPPVTATDYPCREAVTQTLEGVWSDLFALLTDSPLEADAEDLGWGLVNIFHRAAERKSGAVDRATDEVRALLASADGSEVHTHDLETQIERAQCAESAMLALEEMREVAATLFLGEFGSVLKFAPHLRRDRCRARARPPARRGDRAHRLPQPPSSLCLKGRSPMPLDFLTPFDCDGAASAAPKPSPRANLRRILGLAADGCYLLIKGSAFTVSTFLMTLGLPLFFFLLLSGWNIDLLFAQLGNLTARYADAEAARQQDFSMQFQVGFLAVATLVAMWRIPRFVAEVSKALDRKEKF